MDVDCDGIDYKCKGNPDGQDQTDYGALAAYEAPFMVIPESFVNKNEKLLPGNNVVAVICGGKMFYAIFGDTNGDSPEVIGEASWRMAQACFPTENLNGNNGHVPADVTCTSLPLAPPPLTPRCPVLTPPPLLRRHRVHRRGRGPPQGRDDHLLHHAVLHAQVHGRRLRRRARREHRPLRRRRPRGPAAQVREHVQGRGRRGADGAGEGHRERGDRERRERGEEEPRQVVLVEGLGVPPPLSSLPRSGRRS